ncbi:MAG: hypothetical protein JJE21_03785 [Spirochaetaceae bacterium]|nr:hypothetical protein [Spirochaetaceae bacterium]
MRKKIAVLLITLISIFSISAEEKSSSLFIGLDLGYLDPFVNNTIYNQIVPRINVVPGLDLELDLNLVIPKDSSYDSISFGSTLNLDYSPFNNGLFFSFSLFDIAYVFGNDAPLNRLNFLNQLGFGYTFYINRFALEPALIFINPNGVYDETVSELSNSLGGYPFLRFQFLLSYKICDF